jgi:hypothetical protein
MERVKGLHFLNVIKDNKKTSVYGGGSRGEQVGWEGLEYPDVGVTIVAHTLTHAGPSAMMGEQTERGGKGA